MSKYNLAKRDSLLPVYRLKMLLSCTIPINHPAFLLNKPKLLATLVFRRFPHHLLLILFACNG